ncbi:IclR family transcriptional regulator [Natribacillus halophilus]|nr:IclR family transcriptional regulator [Natribacillus halophilus]
MSIMEAKRNNVISKSFKIIQTFIDVKSQWGVRDLARYLDMPVSTLHRLCSNLEEEKILEFNPQINKYEIGIEMIRMSASVSSKIDIKKISKPLMEEYVEKHKQSLYLILYHKYERKLSFIDKVNGPDPLQYHINIGDLQPIPYGGSGKAILAFLSQYEFESIVKNENFTDEQIQALIQELEIIRENYFVYGEEGRIKGSKGFAAPVFDALGNVIGSICHTIPITDDFSNEEEIIVDIKKTSKEISKLIGYKET